MITIIADDEISKLGAQLHEGLTSRGAAAEYIPLQDVTVKQCIGCGACNGPKSFGKCVFRDDADWILSKLIHADSIIIVSPVTFGSYSFKVKRVLDKLALIMDRHYYVRNGELVKNNRTGELRLYAVGITDDENGIEAEAFKKLARELLIITQCRGKDFITGLSPTPPEREEILREVLGA